MYVIKKRELLFISFSIYFAHLYSFTHAHTTNCQFTYLDEKNNVHTKPEMKCKGKYDQHAIKNLLFFLYYGTLVSPFLTAT